jgi:hypothetical protein
MCSTIHCTYASLNNATCAAHLILIELIIRIIFGEEYKLRSSPIMQFSRASYYLMPLESRHSPQIPTIYVLPSVQETNFHTPAKSQTKLKFCILLRL